MLLTGFFQGMDLLIKENVESFSTASIDRTYCPNTDEVIFASWHDEIEEQNRFNLTTTITMIKILGDSIKYQGEADSLESVLPLPISMPEFRKRCQDLFKCSYLFLGHSSKWEIADDNLYLVSSNGTIKVNDKDKYRAEKLRLRKLLRRGEITPMQNGHMLKAMANKTRFETQVGLEFMLGKPAPIFADWITRVIPFPIRVEHERFKNSPPDFQFFRTAYLHVVEGKLVERSFEKPDNLEKDSCPGDHGPQINPEWAPPKIELFSEEQQAQWQERQRMAMRNAISNIGLFDL